MSVIVLRKRGVQPAGDTTGPVITNVVSAAGMVSWNLDEPGTGQVEYGSTTSYGYFSTLEPDFLTFHAQTIPALLAGWHFRIISVDQAGNSTTSADYSVSAAVYRGGVQCDSRDNHRIGSTGNNKVSHRFIASTTSAVTGFRLQERGLGGGTTYSGGTGGTIRASMQADVNGLPSGTMLCSTQWNPGNPTGSWEVWPLHTFSSGATLTAGQTYHMVLENIDPNPTVNYISINDLFWFNNGANISGRRTPCYPDEFATLERTTGAWNLGSNLTPIFDLIYANGVHDGCNYIGSMESYYRKIISTTSMVRERFTATESYTIDHVSVKVKRISGTGDLTIAIKEGSTTLASGTVPASEIMLGGYPNVAADWTWQYGNNSWATIEAAVTIETGHTYDVQLSTDASTEYICVGVQQGDSKGMDGPNFGGVAQYTTNSGSSWGGLYAYDNTDLQFFFSSSGSTGENTDDYETAVLVDSPVAYYRLGDTAGSSTAADSAGSLTATATAVTFGATAMLAGDTTTAATFNGTSSIVYASCATFPSGSAARSLEAWVRTTSTSTSGDVFGYGSSAANSSFCMRVDNGVLKLIKRNAAGTGYDIYTFGGTVNDGDPHHIVVTFDGSSTAKGYVDGVQVGTDQTISTVNTVVTGQTFSLGVFSGYYTGDLQECAVYATELTPVEVGVHYAVGS